MILTYAGLQAEIQSWLDNTSPTLVAAIPTFIQFAETHFGRELHLRDMECRATTPEVPVGVTEDGLGVYDLPADWGGHKVVERYGGVVTMLYYRKITPLSDAAPSNWLLTKYPDLYLYASLAQSEAWLKNDPRVQSWAGAASAALAGVIEHDDTDRLSGGPLRTRSSVRRPWAGRGSRLEYLPPFDFYDLEASGQGVSGDPPGYFTTTETFLKIYPKPAMPA